MSQADDPDLRAVSPLFDMLDLVYVEEFRMERPLVQVEMQIVDALFGLS